MGSRVGPPVLLLGSRAGEGLTWSPIFIAAVLWFYFMMAFLYVLSDPGIIVSGLFKIVDIIPNYAHFATKAIGAKFAEELGNRLR